MNIFKHHEAILTSTHSTTISALELSARSHGASATAIRSTIMGVADACHTKWVQDPLTATGSAHFVTIFDAVRLRSRSVWTNTENKHQAVQSFLHLSQLSMDGAGDKRPSNHSYWLFHAYARNNCVLLSIIYHWSYLSMIYTAGITKLLPSQVRPFIKNSAEFCTPFNFFFWNYTTVNVSCILHHCVHHSLAHLFTNRCITIWLKKRKGV